MNNLDSQISLYTQHLFCERINKLNYKFKPFYEKNIIYTDVYGYYTKDKDGNYINIVGENFVNYYFDNNNIKQLIYPNKIKHFEYGYYQYPLLFLPAENWNLKLKYDQEKNKYDEIIQYYYNKFSIYNGLIVDGTYYASATGGFCLFQIKNNITNIIYGKCYCNIATCFSRHPISESTMSLFIKNKWIKKIDYLLLPNFNITVNSN